MPAPHPIRRPICWFRRHDWEPIYLGGWEPSWPPVQRVGHRCARCGTWAP